MKKPIESAALRGDRPWIQRVIVPSIVLATIALLLAGCPIPGGEAAPADTTPPAGTVIINNGDAYAVATQVTLTLSASDNSGTSGMRMMICDSDDFSGSSWEVYASTRAWTLTAGDGAKVEGEVEGNRL